MPTPLSLEKTTVRQHLRGMAPVRLRRPIFFAPGWNDPACLVWTEPDVEGGIDRRPGWEYTMQDWLESLVHPADRHKVHFLRMVHDEAHLTVHRYATGGRRGKVKQVSIAGDHTVTYENFFQFAELAKAKIRSTGATEYDLVGYSMGGLALIAAVLLDRRLDQEREVQRFITTPPLTGGRCLATVATAFRGSPVSAINRHTILDDLFVPSLSRGVRKQSESMAPEAPFIQIVTHPPRQRRLVQALGGRVHTFGSRNDPVVPDHSRKIDGAVNHPAAGFRLARHTLLMGIAQDPRLALALLTILTR